VSAKKESESVRYYVSLKAQYKGSQVQKAVEKAADDPGVNISHIGGYSRIKYPNYILWHIKELPRPMT